MTLPWQPIFEYGAPALVVLLVPAAVVLFLTESRRGRLRCPKCWYDMRGTATSSHEDETVLPPPWRCPECGRIYTTVRSLRRTRFRRRLACPMLLVALVVGLARTEDLWIRHAPSAYLIYRSDPIELQLGTPTHSAAIELKRRMNAGTLVSFEARMLIGKLEAQWKSHDDVVWARMRWPRGESLHVYADPRPIWLMDTPWEETCTLRVRLRKDASGSAGAWATHTSELFPPQSLDLGVPPQNVGEVSVDVEMLHRGKRLWHTTQPLAVETMAPMENVLAPVTDATLDRAFITWLDPQLHWGREGRVLLSYSTDGRERVFGGYAALGFRATVFRGGVAFGSTDIVCLGPTGLRCGNDSARPFAGLERICDVPDTGEWEIDIAGLPELALRDFLPARHISAGPPGSTEPTSYWAGHVRVPVKISGWN